MTLIGCHHIFTPVLTGIDRAGTGRKPHWSLILNISLQSSPHSQRAAPRLRRQESRVRPAASRAQTGTPAPTRDQAPAARRAPCPAKGTPGWRQSWQEGNHAACSHLLTFTLSLLAPTAVPGEDPLRDRPGGCGSRAASGTLSWSARARSPSSVYSPSPLVCGIIEERGKKRRRKKTPTTTQDLWDTPPCGSVPLGSSLLPAHLFPHFLPFAQDLGRAQLAACIFHSRASAKKAHE